MTTKIEWVHVDSATKIPSIRTGMSPFEWYPEGMSPNDSPAFGPDKPTQFLLVIRHPDPTYNPVLEKLEDYTTYDDVKDVLWLGHYVDPNWEIALHPVPTTLAEAQEAQHMALRDAEAAAISAGYQVGTFAFPFTEDFFTLLTVRFTWLDHAVTDGVVPSDHTITFSDLHGKEVSRELPALRNHYLAYGKEYLAIAEEVVRVTDAIESATTPAEVDAITWAL